MLSVAFVDNNSHHPPLIFYCFCLFVGWSQPSVKYKVSPRGGKEGEGSCDFRGHYTYSAAGERAREEVFWALINYRRNNNNINVGFIIFCNSSSASFIVSSSSSSLSPSEGHQSARAWLVSGGAGGGGVDGGCSENVKMIPWTNSQSRSLTHSHPTPSFCLVVMFPLLAPRLLGVILFITSSALSSCFGRQRDRERERNTMKRSVT